MKHHYQSCLRRVLACLAACVVLSPSGLWAKKGDPFTVEIDGIYYRGDEGVWPDVQAYTPESGVTMGDVIIPSYIEYNGTAYYISCCRFPNATISKLTLPSTIRTVDCTFEWFPKSNIGELVLSEGVSQLDYGIFSDGNIDMLCLPNSLKRVSKTYVYGTTNIGSVKVKSISTICELEVQNFGVMSAVAPLMNSKLYVGNELVKNLVVPDNVKVINGFVFQLYTYLESVDTGNGVERIGACAFEGCENLKEIKVGKRVSTIGEGAFNFAGGNPTESFNLRTIVIPNNVDTIYGIGDCYSYGGMVELILEDGAKDLIMSPNNDYALGYCGRNVMFRAKDFADHSNYALDVFRGLWSDTFEIGGLVSDISDFDPANGRSHVVDEDILKEIISHAVWPPKACEFTELQYKTVSLEVPAMSKHLYRNAPIWENFFKRGRAAFRARNMNFYGDAASREASLTFGDEDYAGHLVIPDEVVYDGDEIVYSVTSVGSHSFAGCDKLRAVTLPASVTAIENNAFTECVALDSIVLMSAVPPKCDVRSFKRVAASAYAAREVADDAAVDDIFANTILYVPEGSVTAYRNADGWGEFANIQEQKAVTSLDAVGVASSWVKVSGDGIVIANGDGCRVEVYSIDGQLVNSSLSYDGERIALPKGAYIVKVGAEAMKVSL